MDEVQFLHELVSIPSLSGDERLLAEHLSWRMTELGFDVRRDAVGNVVGVIGNPKAERNIMCIGHMDTVPGLIPVRREEGRLFGRGAVDAKGPLAAFALAGARVAPAWEGACLTVVGAVGEEAQGHGAHYLAETMPAPTCVIIGEPSSWEGITLGYKGMLSVTFKMKQPSGHGASGRAVPAERAVGFFNRLSAYAESVNEGKRWCFSSLDLTLRGIHTFGDGLEQGVEMDIGLRIPLGLDVASLQRRMRSWCDGGEVAFPYSEPPFRAEKNTPLVRALLRAIRAEGGRPRFKLKTGTSDMNVVGPTWGCPIVAYGPGDSGLDHTPDEHLEIDEFRRAINVLANALDGLGS
jgi:LysW-gamma-L-lysine carboxypeptidase